MRQCFVRLLVIFSVWCVVVDRSDAQNRGSAQAVASSVLYKSMQSTGRPALIIAGNASCVYCREMVKELDSNSALQPYVQGMYVVKIDVESRDWLIVRDTFQFQESGIPAVFFVRADGKLLYSEAGKPSDMEAFLKEQTEQAGQQLDEKTLKALARDAVLAAKALKRKDYAKAQELASKNTGTGSFAAAAVAFDRLGEQLVEVASKLSSTATENLADSKKSVEAALDLLKLPTTFADYEPARNVAEEALATARQEAAHHELLDAAAKLQPAREAEAGRKWKDAVAAYEGVAGEVSEGPVHEYAAKRAELLRPRVR